MNLNPKPLPLLLQVDVPNNMLTVEDFEDSTTLPFQVACRGDSGGPLSILTSDTAPYQYTILGVLSSGDVPAGKKVLRDQTSSNLRISFKSS